MNVTDNIVGVFEGGIIDSTIPIFAEAANTASSAGLSLVE